VSWVREKDSHILSVDGEVFIQDQRFTSLLKENNQWTLMVGKYFWLAMCFKAYSTRIARFQLGYLNIQLKKRIHMKILFLFYLKCLFNIFLSLKTTF
jgi:hypothetical protein